MTLKAALASVTSFGSGAAVGLIFAGDVTRGVIVMLLTAITCALLDMVLAE